MDGSELRMEAGLQPVDHRETRAPEMSLGPRNANGSLGRVAGTDLGSVAIVHDYLNQRGGAERVGLEITRMWPAAPVYPSLYRRRSVFLEYADADIRTTFVIRPPLDKAFL